MQKQSVEMIVSDTLLQHTKSILDAAYVMLTMLNDTLTRNIDGTFDI